MNYKSIFNAVSTKNLFKGGVMSRLAFSAGGRVFESAVMFFVLIFASIGCNKAGGQTTNDLVGVWVFMEGSSKGKDVNFLSEGRGTGYSYIKGCRSVAGYLGEERGTRCADKFIYEKVGDVLFLKSVDGSPLFIDYGSAWPNTIEKYDEKLSFEILENGKYLKLDGELLKKVENVDALRKEQAAEQTKQANQAAFVKAIRAGNAAFENDNIDAVIANYTEAIRLIPESVDEEIYLKRGTAYFMKDDYDKAIADLTQVIRLNPNNAHAYYIRANAWAEKKNYDKAIADFGETLRLNPNNAEAYNSRGWWLATIKKDYDRAIADCNAAIRLNPGFASAYDSRGFAYASKKDYDRAIADYTAALRIDPSLEESYLGRGNAYNEKREYKKAIPDFKKVLRMSKDSEIIKKANEGLERAQRESGKK